MCPTKVNFGKRRPALVDRLELWLSKHRQVDGLWIGTYECEAQPVLQTVETALDLIAAYDRVRYDRLRRDLKRVWVRTLFGDLANFNESADACELDVRFVLDAEPSPETVASIIVHEATHARLWHRGIGYEAHLRSRVEAVCFRRELAFAKKLPNGKPLRKRAERMLDLCASNDFWTNTAFKERHVEGAIEAARYVGLPVSIANILLLLRESWGAVRRQLHRLKRL